MSEDFRDVLASFTAHSVEFLVVGAHALAAHGVPRVTGDLDLWVRCTQENSKRAVAALVEFGAPLGQMGISESDLQTADQVIQLGLPPFRVDIMTSISGVTWDVAWMDRFHGTLFDVTVPFLGKASLVRNKIASRSRERPA